MEDIQFAELSPSRGRGYHRFIRNRLWGITQIRPPAGICHRESQMPMDLRSGTNPILKEAGDRLRLVRRQAGLTATVGSEGQVCSKMAGSALPWGGAGPARLQLRSLKGPDARDSKLLPRDSIESFRLDFSCRRSWVQGETTEFARIPGEWVTKLEPIFCLAMQNFALSLLGGEARRFVGRRGQDLAGPSLKPRDLRATKVVEGERITL